MEERPNGKSSTKRILALLRETPRTAVELSQHGYSRTALRALVKTGEIAQISEFYFLPDPAFPVWTEGAAERLQERLADIPELVSPRSPVLQEVAANPALLRHLLEILADQGAIFRFRYGLQALYLHRNFLPGNSPTPKRILGRDEVLAAYRSVRQNQLGSAVFVADLARALGVSADLLHDWIRTEVMGFGVGALDEGHWPGATAEQKAAAIDYLGRKRLLIRF